MGTPIQKAEFEPQEYVDFEHKCRQQLNQLQQILAEPNFSQGKQKFGCEVEFSLIQADGSPAPINQKIIQLLQNDDYQSELNQYNLEYNLQPTDIEGEPFSALEANIKSCYKTLNETAATLDAQAVMIGILPSVTTEHFGAKSMTPELRYKALCKGIQALNSGPVNIQISGEEPLWIEAQDLTVEGANTSIQLHLQVTPESFADWHNAIQMATSVAVAISGNSPLFVGHQLWDETRIAVFKQALESRKDRFVKQWRQPHRVSFGYGWLRKSAMDYFTEIVSLYQPLLPIMFDGDERSLDELRLHNGTVWRWNRGIYDKDHIRIEMRSLPAGPSVPDMVASGAFLIGLAAHLQANIDQYLAAFPFMYAEYNFYRAAQFGYEARLLWPKLDDRSPQEYLASDLALSLVDSAGEGLLSLGVSASEQDKWMGLVKEKIARKASGSNWLKAAINKGDNSDNLLKKVTLEYVKHMQSHQSVLHW